MSHRPLTPAQFAAKAVRERVIAEYEAKRGGGRVSAGPSREFRNKLLAEHTKKGARGGN